MRKAWRFKWLAAAIMAVVFMAGGAFAQELPRIAVYVTGDVPDNEKKALGTRMLASLVNSGRYKGIERSNAFLAEIENEQIRQRSGAIDDGQISELGRQFGVKFVCIADITPAFGEFQVSARIVNVETAEVDFIGESASSLKSMADLARVSDQVVKNMFGEEAKSAVKAKTEPEPEAPAPKPEAPVTYTIATAAKPSNGGAVSANPQKEAYNAGEQVTLTATPHSGFAFANWSGAAASAKNPVTVTVNGSLTLTANFQPIYTLTVYAQPVDGGTVSVSPKKAAYTAGEQVTLTAKPSKGYTFANWSGAAASANGSIAIIIDNNVTLTANFQGKPEPRPKPKPEPKPEPEPKPKPEPKPEPEAKPKLEPRPEPEARPKPEAGPKPEFKISAGGGAFFANGIGGGLTWENSKENLAMPYTAGGAYLFFDAVYAEAFIGFSAGGGTWQSGDATYQNGLPDMPRVCANIGAFAKYPIAAGKLKTFPLLGFEYEASVSGKLVYAGGKEEAFDGADGRPDAGALSALWFRFGCGADFDLSQSLYLRAEFLYGLRTANAYENDRANEEAEFGGNTRAGHGFTLKAGAGIKF